MNAILVFFVHVRAEMQEHCKKECKRDNETERTFEVECDCDNLGLRQHNIAEESEEKGEQRCRMSFIS